MVIVGQKMNEGKGDKTSYTYYTTSQSRALPFYLYGYWSSVCISSQASLTLS